MIPVDSIFLKKLFLLFTLYFVQACPYGFQAGCLPIILRQNGLSFSNLGAIKLLYLPWIFKPLIALKVEQRKRFWVFFTLTALAVICFWSANYVSILQLFQISVMLLAFNTLCATLDICVDSMSVNLLDEDELGAASTVQVVGYKTGAAVSGGVLLLMFEHFGWALMFYGFGLLYCVVVVGLHYMESIPSEQTSEQEVNALNVKETLKYLYGVPGTGWMILFVLVYKLNTHSTDMIPLYLSDKGLSTDSLAIGNSVGRLFSIAGSTYSGYLLTKENAPVRLMKYFNIAQLGSIFLQYIVIILWGTGNLDWSRRDSYFTLGSYIGLYWNLFCSGAITTGCFTMMMSLSKTVSYPTIQGTYFSILCTFEVLGKILFASLAGLITDVYGPSLSILMCFGLTLFTLLTLKWLPHKKLY